MKLINDMAKVRIKSEKSPLLAEYFSFKTNKERSNLHRLLFFFIQISIKNTKNTDFLSFFCSLIRTFAAPLEKSPIVAGVPAVR